MISFMKSVAQNEKEKFNLPPVIVEHPGARKNLLEHVHEKGRSI